MTRSIWVLGVRTALFSFAIGCSSDGSPPAASGTNDLDSGSGGTGGTSAGLDLACGGAGCADSPDLATIGNGTGGNDGSASSPYAFADEFDGTTVNTNLWIVLNQHAEPHNSEAACYRPNNVTVSGGYLNETAKVESAACPDRTGTMVSEGYTSGAIQMKSFSFLYGTVEARAKFAGGTWPAIWLLGEYCQLPTWLTGTAPDPPDAAEPHGIAPANRCNWPNIGSEEVDIAEVFNGASTINQSLQGGGGSCQPLPPTGTPQDWHVYTLVWTPTSVTWLIDGTTTCMLTDHVPVSPMFLIINTTVGGLGGGTPDPTSFPQTTSIDYVHVITSNVVTP
jgi:beta-glucanase (GH16 family)